LRNYIFRLKLTKTHKKQYGEVNEEEHEKEERDEEKREKELDEEEGHEEEEIGGHVGSLATTL